VYIRQVLPRKTVNVGGIPAIKHRRRNVMKYVVSWTFRSFGSVAEQEAAATRLLKTYSKWTPPASVTYHQFLGRIDGGGGYQVVETDSTRV
jgi:hypothetical protein